MSLSTISMIRPSSMSTVWLRRTGFTASITVTWVSARSMGSGASSGQPIKSAEPSERMERAEALVNVMIANLVCGDLWLFYEYVGALCSGLGGKRSPG